MKKKLFTMLSAACILLSMSACGYDTPAQPEQKAEVPAAANTAETSAPLPDLTVLGVDLDKFQKSESAFTRKLGFGDWIYEGTMPDASTPMDSYAGENGEKVVLDKKNRLRIYWNTETERHKTEFAEQLSADALREKAHEYLAPLLEGYEYYTDDTDYPLHCAGTPDTVYYFHMTRQYADGTDGAEIALNADGSVYSIQSDYTTAQEVTQVEKDAIQAAFDAYLEERLEQEQNRYPKATVTADEVTAGYFAYGDDGILYRFYSIVFVYKQGGETSHDAIGVMIRAE